VVVCILGAFFGSLSWLAFLARFLGARSWRAFLARFLGALSWRAFLARNVNPTSQSHRERRNAKGPGLRPGRRIPQPKSGLPDFGMFRF
jgi:hypothetical protein